MKPDLYKRAKRLQGWATIFSIFTGLTLLIFSITSVVPEGREIHTRIMVFVCLSFVCLSTLAAACCGLSWSLRERNASHSGTLIVRIVFYGLFLLGPMLLSWGHVFHIKAKQRNQELSGLVSVEGYANNPYVNYCAICDSLGAVCAGCWFLWLWCTIVAKSTCWISTLYFRHTELIQAAKRNSNMQEQE